MKEVVNVAVGNKGFTLETDAYQALRDYLDAFRTKSSAGVQSDATMYELEDRIAEILSMKISYERNVVNIAMIDEITAQLGMPDGSPYSRIQNQSYQQTGNTYYQNRNSYAAGGYGYAPKKKLYRDVDNAFIGGVCAGLGHYLDFDTTIIKIIFLILFLFVGGGLLLYIILWIVAPPAKTPVEKCEMRGWPLTAENLARFTRR
ncbi:MAG: PspC domain-containing protein [Bacteroidales bacterium]|nr:PspC domain-containing protein [Bacteroidales bacterium]MBP5518435.1 PspC domain-containing protein [Bacteroidales bacterium]